MLALIYSYIYNTTQPPDYIDPDSPEQTIKYVFLEKIKSIEEDLSKNINKTYKLENTIDDLKKENKRLQRSLNHLYNRIQYLEEKLNNSIVLESLPNIIVDR